MVTGFSSYISKVVKIDSFRNSILKNKDNILNNVTKGWSETNDLISTIDILNNPSLNSKEKSRLEEKFFSSVSNPEYKFRKRLSGEFRKDFKENNNGKMSEYMFIKNNKN